MAGLLTKLDTALDRVRRGAQPRAGFRHGSFRADLRQMEGREALVKARVAMHAFQVAARGQAGGGRSCRSGGDAPRRRESLEGSRLAPHRAGVVAGNDSGYNGRALDGNPLAGVEKLSGPQARREVSHVFVSHDAGLAERRAAWSRPTAPRCAAAATAPSTNPGRASTHAQAMESRLFQDVLEMAQADFGAGRADGLPGLPFPDGSQIGDERLARKVSWEGVTCDYCHSIRDVSFDGRNPKAVVNFGMVKTGPLSDAVSRVASDGLFSGPHLFRGLRRLP